MSAGSSLDFLAVRGTGVSPAGRRASSDVAGRLPARPSVEEEFLAVHGSSVSSSSRHKPSSAAGFKPARPSSATGRASVSAGSGTHAKAAAGRKEGGPARRVEELEQQVRGLREQLRETRELVAGGTPPGISAISPTMSSMPATTPPRSPVRQPRLYGQEEEVLRGEQLPTEAPPVWPTSSEVVLEETAALEALLNGGLPTPTLQAQEDKHGTHVSDLRPSSFSGNCVRGAGAIAADAAAEASDREVHEIDLKSFQLATAAVLALRRWLKTQCGTLQLVAERIRSVEDAMQTSSRLRANDGEKVSRGAVTRFLTDVDCQAVADGTLACIFECLDPGRSGMICLDDLLGPSHAGGKMTTDSAAVSQHVDGDAAVEPAAAALASGPLEAPGVLEAFSSTALGHLDELAKVEAEERRLKGELLTAEHWLVLKRVFCELVKDGCDEAVAAQFIQKIRGDTGVQQGGLLERVIETDPRDRRTTLAQALEHIDAQGLLTLTFEQFRRMVMEAPQTRRSTLRELIVESTDRAGFDPNQEQERAIHWMETVLGVDGSMLRRVHERFIYCQKGAAPASAVRRGDFVHLLQNAPNLRVAFVRTPICPPLTLSEVRRPQYWGDVLLHLSCHESDVLTWVDVLDVVRWHRDLCLDLVPAAAVGPGGHSWEHVRPGPVLQNGDAKERLTRLMVGADETPAAPEQSPTLSLGARPSPFVAETAAGEIAVEDSRHRPVAAAYEKARLPRRPGSHPFVEYEPDQEADLAFAPEDDEEGGHAAVARLLLKAQRRVNDLGPVADHRPASVPVVDHRADSDGRFAAGPSGPPPPAPWGQPSDAVMPASVVGGGSPAWPTDDVGMRRPVTGASKREAALRVRVGADLEEWFSRGWEKERIENALAEVLNVHPSTVRLKRWSPS